MCSDAICESVLHLPTLRICRRQTLACLIPKSSVLFTSMQLTGSLMLQAPPEPQVLSEPQVCPSLLACTSSRTCQSSAWPTGYIDPDMKHGCYHNAADDLHFCRPHRSHRIHRSHRRDRCLPNFAPTRFHICNRITMACWHVPSRYVAWLPSQCS